MSIADEIRRRREALRLDRTELARRAGLNPTYVRDIEEGKSKNPRSAHLGKLAGALGCTREELLEGAGDPTRAAILAAYEAMSPQQQDALRIVAQSMVAPSDSDPSSTPCILPLRRAEG